MTEQEKQVIDQLVVLAWEEIENVWAGGPNLDESKVKTILRGCIQSALWVGLRHKR